MGRIPSGIPDRFFDHSRYFKVVDINRPRKDEDINETIRMKGAHIGNDPDRDEAEEDMDELAWYMKHKGYSEKIRLGGPSLPDGR
jgi:hypothetical protein